jgi:hypothetical protein
MQPLNDEELRSVMNKWVAPATPTSLESRVMAATRRGQWWRWLVTGSIRVPVPVMAGCLILLLLLAVQTFHKPAPVKQELAAFEPVKELKPRIIRSSHEAN